MTTTTAILPPRQTYPQSPLPLYPRPPPGQTYEYHQGEMPPPSSTLPSKKRKLAPHTMPIMPSSPSVSDTSGDHGMDEEYEPVPSSSRGGAKRKPGTAKPAIGGGGGGKGMSREAIRKANHSLIERRRREKINHALGELRDMVPGLGDAEGGKGGEFKLEVLERTVDHMKELKSRILDLESRLKTSDPGPRGSVVNLPAILKSTKMEHVTHQASSSTLPKPKSPTIQTTSSSSSSSQSRPTPIEGYYSPIPKRIFSPPRPTDSPDPNETDTESNLPPAYTIASRALPSSSSNSRSNSRSNSPRTHTDHPPTPSITSLLASIPSTHAPPPQPTARPQASSQAYNPTLYLPFPTPSPTSPFLNYGLSSNPSSNSSTTTEPSPFLAPMSGIALFGGALSLDGMLMPSPADVLVGQDQKTKGKGSEQEEAAELLLAFSSPDVMRPTGGIGMGVGGRYGVGAMPGIAGGIEYGIEEERGHRRRGTLESEDFILDGGVVGRSSSGASVKKGGIGRGVGEKGVVELRGKTARDILRM